MKKLFTSFILTLLCLNVFGQKDIEFKLFEPLPNQNVYVNEKFTFTYSFKNVGTDWIDFDDSFFVSLKLDGEYILGSLNKAYQSHSNIPPGDSVFYTREFTFTSKLGNAIQFCLELTTGKNGVNFDTDSLNNLSCVQLKLSEKNTSGIANTTNSPKLILYPNPAASSLFIKTNNAEAKKAIISNANGKEIATLKLLNGSAVLQTSEFESGIYLCRVIADDNTVFAIEKLIILK